jgi:hypothetical protein
MMWNQGTQKKKIFSNYSLQSELSITFLSFSNPFDSLTEERISRPHREVPPSLSFLFSES